MDLLLQEFDCEIRDKKDSENLVTDHLSGVIDSKALESHISECFPDEQLFVVYPHP